MQRRYLCMDAHPTPGYGESSVSPRLTRPILIASSGGCDNDVGRYASLTKIKMMHTQRHPLALSTTRRSIG